MTGDLLGRHRNVLPDWLALYYEEPLEITHGEGRHVWDADGNRYLDFFGGILTTMTAHALPEITKAVAEQAGRIIHSSTLYLNRPMVELAERVAKLSGIPDARVFFTTSGTEANDTALMLATTYRRSNTILAMRNSYHGRSFSAVGITGNRGWSPTSLSPSRRCTSTAASAPAARTRISATTTSSRPAWTTSGTCSVTPARPPP
ncbi:Acetylornithine/succinyldiaminopimelate aminotransferase [Streptomyces alboniger]